MHPSIRPRPSSACVGRRTRHSRRDGGAVLMKLPPFPLTDSVGNRHCTHHITPHRSLGGRNRRSGSQSPDADDGRDADAPNFSRARPSIPPSASTREFPEVFVHVEV